MIFGSYCVMVPLIVDELVITIGPNGLNPF
jgi:hypothetical protein